MSSASNSIICEHGQWVKGDITEQARRWIASQEEYSEASLRVGVLQYHRRSETQLKSRCTPTAREGSDVTEQRGGSAQHPGEAVVTTTSVTGLKVVSISWRARWHTFKLKMLNPTQATQRHSHIKNSPPRQYEGLTLGERSPEHVALKASGASSGLAAAPQGWGKQTTRLEGALKVLCSVTQLKAVLPEEPGLDLPSGLGGSPGKTGTGCSSPWGKEC